MWSTRLQHLCETFDIEETKVSVHDHHLCHANYGYYSCPPMEKGTARIYYGRRRDGLNATVSIGRAGEPLELISSSSNCNIGRIYRYATLMLGMRPADHEYKLMGLAAYNSMSNARKAYEVFADTLQVEGLSFGYKTEIKTTFYFKEKLEGMRFDAIAFGLQKRTEELLCEWIVNGVRETGINSVIMSGGVSQNIKANKLIWENKEVDSLFVPPGQAISHFYWSRIF